MAIPEHQLKELNMKIDSALQVVFQSAVSCVCVSGSAAGEECAPAECVPHTAQRGWELQFGVGHEECVCATELTG